MTARVVAGSADVLARLDPLARRRLAFAAVVAVTIALGIAVAVLIGPLVWAVDANRNLLAAIRLRDGAPDLGEGYLYTPLAAALSVPATLIPAAVAILAWLGFKVALLAVGVRHEGDALRGRELLILGLAVAMFAPALHDLLLGNVSLVMTAALAFVAWSDRRSIVPGVPLGIVLATIPKPQLIAFLVWMVIYRPRALVAAVATAGVLTALAIVTVGVDRYSTFVRTLFQVPYLSTPMHGNLALSAMVPPVLAMPLAVIAVAATILALWRGELPGLVASLALGILVAPYAMAYSAAPLLLAARPLAISLPRIATLLAMTASIGVVLFLPAWAGAVLVAALFLPGRLVRRGVAQS